MTNHAGEPCAVTVEILDHHVGGEWQIANFRWHAP